MKILPEHPPVPHPKHKSFKDKSGITYSFLTVLYYAGLHGRQPMWVCECICGTLRFVQGGGLVSGNTKSCGCKTSFLISKVHTVHGMCNSREYLILRGAIARCHSDRNKGYKRYGARGIIVCDRWRFGDGVKSGFECFLEDMGNRPSPVHSLDRYPNNNGNYEPGNVRWATPREQMNNTSTNHLVTWNGETYSMSEWARRIGITFEAFRRRISRGWKIERIMSQPLEKRIMP